MLHCIVRLKVSYQVEKLHFPRATQPCLWKSSSRKILTTSTLVLKGQAVDGWALLWPSLGTMRILRRKMRRASPVVLAASLWYLMMTKTRAMTGAGPGHLWRVLPKKRQQNDVCWYFVSLPLEPAWWYYMLAYKHSALAWLTSCIPMKQNSSSGI